MYITKLSHEKWRSVDYVDCRDVSNVSKVVQGENILINEHDFYKKKVLFFEDGSVVGVLRFCSRYAADNGGFQMYDISRPFSDADIRRWLNEDPRKAPQQN